MSTMLTRLAARGPEEPATQPELDWLAKNFKTGKSDPETSSNDRFRPKVEVHERPLTEGGLTPIRIRISDKWSHRRNALKRW